MITVEDALRSIYTRSKIVREKEIYIYSYISIYIELQRKAHISHHGVHKSTAPGSYARYIYPPLPRPQISKTEQQYQNEFIQPANMRQFPQSSLKLPSPLVAAQTTLPTNSPFPPPHLFPPRPPAPSTSLSPLPPTSNGPPLELVVIWAAPP